MKTKTLLDVVIVCGGRFDMLEKCLKAVYENAAFPISVCVVDNGSDKEKRNTNIHLFQPPDNPNIRFETKRLENSEGYPRTHNEGAKLLSSPIICFMDDDIQIVPGFFEEIIKIMGDRNIGVCGAKLLFPEDSTNPHRPGGKVQHIGLALDVTANAVHPLVGWSPDNSKTRKSRETLAVTGALLVIRRDIFRDCGGFDTIYGHGYWEDLDLCLKVRQKGYKILVDCNLTAYHYTGATGEMNPNHNSDFRKNRDIFRTKWGNSGLLVYDSWTYG